MSTDDPDRFEEVVRALRDEGRPPPEDVRRVRRRVLETLGRKQERPRRLTPWLLPIAATLAATTALAATGTLTTLVKALSATEEPAESPSSMGTATSRVNESARKMERKSEESDKSETAAADGKTEAAESETTSTSTPTSTPTPTSKDAPRVPLARTSAPAPSTVAAPAPSASEAAERVELARYRTAHALHFNARNYAAALPEWDSYLAAFPSGSLVSEARYNRAICLLELGRTREGEAALRPFADGAVAGGYRRAEARALLEAAMDGDAGR